jgi:hypothetical protein
VEEDRGMKDVAPGSPGMPTGAAGARGTAGAGSAGSAGSTGSAGSPGSTPGAGGAKGVGAQDPDTVVYRALIEAASSGRRVVLATVVEARGSTPRGVGSKMVIDPAAGLVGTIGGGCGEGEVIEASSSVLDTGRPMRVRVELMDDEESWSPAVCGGFMDVLLESVGPDVD